mgnify:FL=1
MSETYEWISNPNNGSGLGQVERNGKYGFINKKGKLVIPLMYEDAIGFASGYCAVQVGEKWGYINEKNELVIPAIYDWAGDFYNGEAIVINNTKEYTLKLTDNGEITVK